MATTTYDLSGCACCGAEYVGCETCSVAKDLFLTISGSCHADFPDGSYPLTYFTGSDPDRPVWTYVSESGSVWLGFEFHCRPDFLNPDGGLSRFYFVLRSYTSGYGTQLRGADEFKDDYTCTPFDVTFDAISAYDFSTSSDIGCVSMTVTISE